MHVSKRLLLLQLAACAAPWAGIAPARAQTSDTAAGSEILIGQSCQLTGPFATLCQEAILGARLAFDAVNAGGGIAGRKIRVISLDDAYDPKRTAENTRKLIDEHGVLSLFQCAGTPTALAAAAVAEEKAVPFFAAYTGSDALRQKFGRYVFNIKASYGDELVAMVRQQATVGIARTAVVYLDNSFGTSGLAAVEKEAGVRQVGIVAKAALPPDGSRLQEAVNSVAKGNPAAVIMVTAGKPSIDFIDAYQKAGHRSTFYMLSVTNNTQLVQALGERARGIVISQVLPSPWNQSLAVVREFQKLAAGAELGDYTFSHMEGFIAAKGLIDALRRCGRTPTRAGLVRALEETRRLDLGGYIIELSPTKHSSGTLVDLMILDSSGRFRK